MSDEINRIDIKEFRKRGYLQELNRQFLHPLGMALDVTVDEETGAESLCGVWDYRDDPEGIIFGDIIDLGKAENVLAEMDDARIRRLELLGFNIQPLPEKSGDV